MGCKIGAVPLVFADDGTESDPFELQEGTAILGFVTDADWTAAEIGLSVSLDDPQSAAELAAATFVPLYEADGTNESGVAASAPSCAYRTGELKGFRWAKVRSGTTETPVAQAGGPTTLLVVIGKAM